MDRLTSTQAPTPTPDPIPGTYSSKLIQPIPAQPHPPIYINQNPYAAAMYNPYGYVTMPNGALLALPPPANPVPLTNLAVPPNPTYHHLLPYLDSLISQRRASNPHPHLPPTAPANLASGLGGDVHAAENFIHTEGSYFCRTPSPANRQRTAQACVKCRERKTKCTGASPCARCTARGLVCTYASAKEKGRGPARNRSELRTGDDPNNPLAHPTYPPQPPITIQTPAPVMPMFNQDIFMRPQPQFLAVPTPASVPMLRGWDDSSESDASSCPSSATSSRFSISSAGSSDSSLPSTPADEPISLPSPLVELESQMREAALARASPHPFLELSPLLVGKPPPAFDHPVHQTPLLQPQPQLAAARSPPVLLTLPEQDGVRTFRSNEEYYRFLIESMAPNLPPIERPTSSLSEQESESDLNSDASMVTVDLNEPEDASMASISACSSSTNLEATPRPQRPKSSTSTAGLSASGSGSSMSSLMPSPSPSALLAEYLTEDALNADTNGMELGER